jgi:hypothetical protein
VGGLSDLDLGSVFQIYEMLEGLAALIWLLEITEL